MKLTIAERIMLQDVLPQEGNYVTFKLLRKLRGELSFTEDEIKDYGIKANPDPNGSGQIFYSWKPEAVNETKEVEIGDTLLAVIQEQLKKLDSEGKITQQTFDLYEKFMK